MKNLNIIIPFVVIATLTLITLSFTKINQNRTKIQEVSNAKELIQKSIAYHDQKGNWKNFEATIIANTTFQEPKRKGQERTTELYFNNKNGEFKIYSKSPTIEYRGEIGKDTCYNSALNELSEEVASKYKSVLSCDGISFYKNYYSYLIGMPMKLEDNQAIINDTLFERTYNNVAYDVVKVNYEPLDKSPVWYFYFDKNTHAFELSKFTSREDENKGGEYIIYNNEEKVNDIILKTQQVWLYNTPNLDSLAVDNFTFINK